MLIGLATLEKIVARPDWFAVENPAKVSRAWLYRMLFFTLFWFYSNTLTRAWVRRLRKKIRRI
jgi:hypothetical protein